MKRKASKSMIPDVERAVSDLGDHLKSARLARNLTVAALAARANISVATVNRMESGDGAVALARWAACFQIVGLLGPFTRSVAPEHDERGEVLRGPQLRRHARTVTDDNDF